MRQSTFSSAFVLAVVLSVVPALAIQAPIFGKCGGGDGYKAECPAGYKCQVINPYYSQCVPVKYGDPVSPREVPSSGYATMKKRATPPFDPVVGADGTCQPRRKIQTLQSSYPAVFNMFIVALEALQATSESLDISWFQISGIHGAPKIAYQMDPLVSPSGGPYNTWLGYCTHGSVLFTTWHRPYLLLLEQGLYRKAKQIATQFTGSAYATYNTAAEQVRLPYWDWSDRTSCLPDITMQSAISVVKPGTGGVATSYTIPNPLFQYKFQSAATLAAYFSGPNFNQWMYTRRRPGPVASGAPSNNAAACTAMQNGYTTRRTQTYAALNSPAFNSFSTQLENIHNAVHTTVGGSNPIGHMSTVDVAGFDPIFWLHHVNADRLFAMYQAAHPLIYLTPGYAVATFARIVPGIDGPLDSLTTNLYPFKHPNGAFFKSDEIKTASSIWTYKYGYDEVPCSYASQSAASLALFTRRRINTLYGPGIVIGPFTPIFNYFIRDDFTIRSVIDHSELPGTWTLHAFLGKPSVKPADYEFAPERIGSFSSFGNPDIRKTSMIFDNEIQISDVLYERKVYYKKDFIIKYLTDYLFWSITTATDGDDVIEIPIENLKTFKIGVYTAVGNYTDPTDSDVLPTYGTPVYLPQCTQGKPGGIRNEKEILFPTLLNEAQIDLFRRRT